MRERDTGLLRRADEGVGERVAMAGVGDPQHPRRSMQRRCEPLVRLGADEDGQHILPPPALGARFGPGVVILALPADVDHRIDGGPAAQRAPLRHKHRAALQPRLTFGFVEPTARRSDHADEGAGDVDEGVVVRLAGFQQQHALARRDEALRHHAAGRATADDDVVVVLHGPLPPFALWGC